MERIRTRRFLHESMPYLLTLTILFVPSAVTLAQEPPPTCSHPVQECISENPPAEHSEPVATQPAQVQIASPPPPIRPFVGTTTSN